MQIRRRGGTRQNYQHGYGHQQLDQRKATLAARFFERRRHHDHPPCRPRTAQPIIEVFLRRTIDYAPAHRLDRASHVPLCVMGETGQMNGRAGQICVAPIQTRMRKTHRPEAGRCRSPTKCDANAAAAPHSAREPSLNTSLLPTGRRVRALNYRSCQSTHPSA